MVLNMINRAGWPRWSSWFCVEFLTTLSGTFYTLLLRDELMEVEIRLAKGEYFQMHPSCVPDLQRLTYILSQHFSLARLSSLQRL